MTTHLRAQWRARVAQAEERPAYPHLPEGWRVSTTSVPSDAWYHYSTTGQIRSPLVHAGDWSAAADRSQSLHEVDWSQVDVDKMLADDKHWKPTSLATMFILELTCPPVNPDEPVSDREANDPAFVREAGGPVLYHNRYERSFGPSVVAPPECWRIIGVDLGNKFTFAPRPLSDAPAIAETAHRYQAASRAYDEWQRRREGKTAAAKVPPYYHGTTSKLSPGDVLLPGDQVGKRMHPDLGYRTDEVYLADKAYATFYALLAMNKSQALDFHVYEVEPLGDVIPGYGEYTTSSARVIREVDATLADLEPWMVQELGIGGDLQTSTDLYLDEDEPIMGWNYPQGGSLRAEWSTKLDDGYEAGVDRFDLNDFVWWANDPPYTEVRDGTASSEAEAKRAINQALREMRS